MFSPKTHPRDTMSVCTADRATEATLVIQHFLTENCTIIYDMTWIIQIIVVKQNTNMSQTVCFKHEYISQLTKNVIIAE